MRRLYFLPFIAMLFIFAACNRGNEKADTDSQDSIAGIVLTTEEDIAGISEVITRFVRAYTSKDNEKVNRLIHPDLGLYVIYRPGVADNFVKTDSINFASPVPDYYPFPDLTNAYALTFEKLPVFSCDDFTWDKEGFICDTTLHPTQLTQIAIFENEFNEGTYSRKALETLENNEKASFRVVVTAENPLIFHVQCYEGAWYVTVLDRAYGGCDA
ncbi:MAG TPA: hypothetical protein PKA53_01970 [Sphingobacterium sp.]|nr:hypothetical protein [Sphingobacterium sp.]